MKRKIAAPSHHSLACGLLEDGNRALFLCRKNADGIETVELPCVLLKKGENPVASLASEFARQTGIDAEAHEIMFEGKHNAGSRKKKMLVPALAFRMTAKNASCKPSTEFSGYRWLAREGLRGFRLAKSCWWL